MDRQTLRDWVHRYNTDGLSGLENKLPPGRPSKLTVEQKQGLVALVEAGPQAGKDKVVRWRRADLRDRLEQDFGLVLHERTVGKLLDALGYRRLSVRPFNPKTDPVAQEVFKKTSPPTYANVAYSDHREHLMIERLRRTDAYSTALSLLAEINGEAIGHILLTKACIVGAHSSVATLVLAPLSVVPEHQSCGVGKRLVRAAQQRAAALGFGSILLVGIPSYYLQFGYEPLNRYPITLPFDAPVENCMILPLAPHALDGIAGSVQYAIGWLDH